MGDYKLFVFDSPSPGYDTHVLMARTKGEAVRLIRKMERPVFTKKEPGIGIQHHTVHQLGPGDIYTIVERN